jgi:hypothetical protein
MSSRVEPNESGEPSVHEAAKRNRNSLDEQDAPRSKRQRTALACESCRCRKTRCNGARPICATCQNLGFNCLYTGPAPAPRHRSSEMEATEKRLQKVEDLLLTIANKHENGEVRAKIQTREIHTIEKKLQRLEDLLVATMGKEQRSKDVATTVQLAAQHEPSTPEDFQPQSKPQPDDSMSRIWPVTHEDTVDGMGSIIFSDESSSGFFGPSSNASFFGKIARTLASGTRTMPEDKDVSQDLAKDISRPPSPLSRSKTDLSSVNSCELPSRTEILRLLEVFFSFTGQFFPYISKASITQVIIESDLVRFKGVRKSWLCLLNAILAMSTTLDGENDAEAEFRESRSDIFFQRAFILSPRIIPNSANLETCEHPLLLFFAGV